MIAIVACQPDWPDQFASLGLVLRETLGDLALRIDHIGSTAVPGLAAKNNIGIQVTAAALTPQLHDALERAGYARLAHITQDHMPAGGSEDPYQWAKWFYNQHGTAPRANLHLRLAGRANQRYALLFRDYLRAASSVAAAYGQAKLALARYHADDVDAYYGVKDPICDAIMGGAEIWAAATRWAPGPAGQP